MRLAVPSLLPPHGGRATPLCAAGDRAVRRNGLSARVHVHFQPELHEGPVSGELQRCCRRRAEGRREESSGVLEETGDAGEEGDGGG